MLDMLTDVFASPGWRATGTPTPIVRIIGRIKTDRPPDYDAVHKIHAGYKVTPQSLRFITQNKKILAVSSLQNSPRLDAGLACEIGRQRGGLRRPAARLPKAKTFFIEPSIPKSIEK